MQIAYSVSVAEEQFRVENGGIADDGFSSAKSLAIEAIVGKDLRTEERSAVVSVHPMFRRTLNHTRRRSRRRSRSVLEGDSEAVNQGNDRTGIQVQDDPIEVSSSDDEVTSRGKPQATVKAELTDNHTGKQEDELDLSSVNGLPNASGPNGSPK